MKQLFLLALVASSFLLSAQLNTTLRSNLTYDDGVNDVWGYVAPDGTEYAIVGLLNGVSFVSLADPDNAVEVVRVPGDRSAWRDMKTFGEYAYAVADQGDEGLVAYDLRFLPDSVPVRLNQYLIPGFSPTFIDAHNIYIDESAGRAYVAGGNRQINDGGILIFDLMAGDPMTPTYIGKGPETYSHDVYVKGDTLYCSEIYDGELALYDISDLDNVTTLGVTNTPFNFTHNAWTTDNGQTIFTTDERANAPVAAYDISNKDDIVELYQFRPLESVNTGTIPHNVHVIDDYLSISYYTDGLVVADASKPDNIIEVANYDTWSGPNGDFNGAWGAYPFLPSGLTLISDRQSGLYVVDVNYKRAARLEGLITDVDLGTPLNGVDVSIAASQLNTGTTDALGRYRTGLADGGSYEVTFTAENYKPLTVTVEMLNGVCTVLDTFMEPTVERFNVKVSVVDDETGAPIPTASFRLTSRDNDDINALSDDTGEVRIDNVFENRFDAYVAEWGYQTVELPQVMTSDLQDMVVRLKPGYMDDFVTDEGWTTSSEAGSGDWERAVPFGTFFGSERFNPNQDANGDIGEEAYVTGNNGTGAGDDDVDGGEVILTSPVFGSLPGQDSLRVSYQYWFANDGGDVPINDTLTVSIDNGEEVVVIRQYTGLQNEWTKDSFLVGKYLRESSQLRLIVTTSDFSFAGHLVEAGFDNFRAYGRSIPTNTEDLIHCADCHINIFPNPSNSFFQLSIGTGLKSPGLRVMDALGRVVESRALPQDTHTLTFGQDLPTGLYFMEILDGNQRVVVRKVVKE